MEKAVVVSWCNSQKMIALAKGRGWVEDADGLLDYVKEHEAEETRECPTLAKAKDWARRNKASDFWGQPSIRVYTWPDRRRRSWQRETVRHIRLVGSGLGWEDILHDLSIRGE